MYSFKNILDSNEKKIITDLLKINESINCLSEYEKLRIESFRDDKEFDLDEWSKIRDYLTYLCDSSVLHHVCFY